ncbi:D-Ala-D-Ala carboxypeptidase family metallohydrolase [Thalassobaculum sp.]|uniref:D-Ala-D-Ala carboxypeptidase family metallohydrolase n=1 Tax=Thalassobaculum sp. TaxID=2022740 RepID=UPI0032EB7F5B
MNDVPLRHPGNGAVLFTQKELACRSDGVTMRFAKGFLDHLLTLRLTLDRPMRVGPENSCSRTPARNAQIDGAANSYHLTEGNTSDGTCAIDVHSPDDAYRHRLVAAALALGWSVGVYRTFVHLDRRVDFGAPAIVFWGK